LYIAITVISQAENSLSYTPFMVNPHAQRGEEEEGPTKETANSVPFMHPVTFGVASAGFLS
jgi:hypothetical protein